MGRIIALAIILVLFPAFARAQTLTDVIGPKPPQLLLPAPGAQSPVSQPTAAPSAPGGTTPVPDPTKLTTEAVDRAKNDLKEVFGIAIAAVVQRIDRLQDQIDGRPPATMLAIEQLQKLVNERIDGLAAVTVQKFIGVDQQFGGRDTALAAALLAQKTAVDEQNKSNALSIAKSDAATTKQIDTIGDNVTTITRGINEKVDDLRSRVQAIESRAIGVNDNKADSGSNWSWVFGIVGALVGIFSLIGAFGFVITHRPENSSNGTSRK